MNYGDGRIRAGLRRQLEWRRQRLGQGETGVGWKAGFGAPSALEQLSLEGPLVGFLTDRSLLTSGSEVRIDSWTRPVAEPEVAVYFDSGLSTAPTSEEVMLAVGDIAPSVELADVEPPPSEVEEVLACNIYHRYVVLGKRVRWSLSNLEALHTTVTLNDGVVADSSFSPNLTGSPIAVIAHLARLLASQGEAIRAGDLMICGSLVPPLPLHPGDLVEFAIHPIGSVSVRAG